MVRRVNCELIRPLRATGTNRDDLNDSEDEVKNPFRWWHEEQDRDDAMPQDSGGARSSNDMRIDDLSQREANGEEENEAEAMGEDEEISEEVRVPAIVKGPQKVTEKEREDHEALHLPYRAWCKYCVRGRGRNMPHAKKKDGKDDMEEVPKVSMDYFFLSEADKKANKNPMLVMIDEKTKDRYARAVGQKGIGDDGNMDWLIKDLSAELKTWGHAGGPGGHIIIKSDGERAIVAVRDSLSKFHGGIMVPEAPAKGESPSNGRLRRQAKPSGSLCEHIESK